MFRTKHAVYFAPEGGASGSGAGGTGGGAVKPEAPGAEKSTLTKEDIEKLNTGVSSLSTAIDKMVKMAEARDARAAAPASEQAPPAEEEEYEAPTEIDEAQLESMSRKDLIKFVEERIGGSLNKSVIKPLLAKLDAIQNNTQTRDLKGEIAAFADKTPDFWEWKDEMAQIARDEGILSPRRLYQLARNDNPEKVKKIADAAKKTKDEADAVAAKAAGKKQPVAGVAKKPAFGGLSHQNSGETRQANMPMRQAAEAAWEEAVATFGGDPFNA